MLLFCFQAKIKLKERFWQVFESCKGILQLSPSVFLHRKNLARDVPDVTPEVAGRHFFFFSWLRSSELILNVQLKWR